VGLNYDNLIAWPFPPRVQSYAERDTVLYALGLGIGANPTDDHELHFVYERNLAALPTMAVVLGHPGNFWSDPSTGVRPESVLHGEHRLTIHSPLPRAGEVRAESRVSSIVDKGRDALVYIERELTDSSSGRLLATQTTTAFCRGAGGFIGSSGPTLPAHPRPDREPDIAIDHPTPPQLALVYRLSGDLNPIHADPAAAAAAGFERPILHGLCTFGIAGYALLCALCGHEPSRLRRIDARFSRPAFPGDTFRTEIWIEHRGQAAFRCRVVGRDITVIDNGYCEFEVRDAA
jgi:acyl dehydratase